ncbi:MAG: GFA family protein [Rhizobiales bacterium]|nr:GFA family protein [Hyphomicrobiales bacterium]
MSEFVRNELARRLKGSCTCGKVSYSVLDEFSYASYCHCSNCRKSTGSAFKAFAGIEIEKFDLVTGSESLMQVGDDRGHDVRCSSCGSYLYSVVREGKYVHVTFGTLIDIPTIRPTEHIFVGSKAEWFTITDDLPQYSKFPI